jgi:hypothetical protein
MRWHRTAPTLVILIYSVATAHAAEAIAASAEEFIRDWVAAVNTNKPEKLLAFYDRSEETMEDRP